MAVIVAVGLVFLGVGITAAVLFARARQLPQRVDNAAADQSEKVAAFGRSGRAAGADAKDATALLDAMSLAMRQRQGSAATDIFDIDRMIDEVCRLPGVPAASSGDRKRMAAGLRTGMGRMLRAEGALQPWDTTEVRMVRPAETPGDIIVYSKLRSADGATRMRWWMHKTDKLRIYDFEDVDAGLRASSIMGRLIAGPDPRDIVTLQQDIQALNQSVVALARSDAEAAEKALSQVRAATLPQDIQCLRHIATGTLRILHQRSDDALHELAQAEALNPTSPIVFDLRAIAHNQKGESEKALQAAARSRELLGPGELNCVQSALALVALGRKAEAAQAYREALLDEPGSVDALAGLASLLDPSQQAEVGAAFAKSAVTRESFEALAGEISSSETAEALRSVAQAYSTRHPDDVAGQYYKALARRMAGEFKAAADDLEQLLDNPDEKYRDAAFEEFLDAKIAAGEALDGYRRCRRPEAALQAMSWRLMGPKNLDAWDSVVSEHLRQFPEDWQGNLYKGRILFERGQVPEAETAYRRALQNAGEDGSRAQVRRAWAYALGESGRVVRAYTEVLGGIEGFDHLAGVCSETENASGLAELITAHRRAEPADPFIPLWEAEASFLRGDYSAAVALLRQHRTVAEGSTERFYHIEDRLVRSLLRLGRIDEALVEAKAGGTPDEPSYYLLLAHCARQDADAAIAVADKLVDSDYDPEDFYEDPDLARLLNTPAMASFRERFPGEFPTSQPER